MDRYLVVTADDLGYSRERDDGIIDCYEAGAITRSSLMVNGYSVEYAAKIAKEYGLPLGLHLNLTEGSPVCDRDNVKSLLGCNGFFLGKNGTRQAIMDEVVHLDEVCKEMAAQILRFQTLTGHLPLYVDGHQHCHVFPGVRDIFASKLSELGIRWTRLPIECLAHSPWIVDPSLSFFKRVIEDSEVAKDVFSSKGIRFTDAFVGLTTMSRNMSLERLRILLSTVFCPSRSPGDCNAQSCELMVHPGFVCPPNKGGCGEGPDEFAQSEDREYEMNIIKSKDMISFYKSNDIKLVTVPV